MDWIQRSAYFSETKDQLYRISWAYVGEKTVYTAWKRIRRYEGCMLAGDTNSKYAYMPILYTEDRSEARSACEDAARLDSRRLNRR